MNEHEEIRTWISELDGDVTMIDVTHFEDHITIWEWKGDEFFQNYQVSYQKAKQVMSYLFSHEKWVLGKGSFSGLEFEVIYQKIG